MLLGLERDLRGKKTSLSFSQLQAFLLSSKEGGILSDDRMRFSIYSEAKRQDTYSVEEREPQYL